VPPPPDVFAAKNALRAVRRQQLERMDAGERRVRSERLLARLVAMAVWRDARQVLLFAPLAAEPDLDLLWSDGSLAGKACAYPQVAGMRMHLLRVRSLADLQPTRWGLREPPVEGSAKIPLAEVDLLLVPGLAFDENGGRLGRGGGFYDRLLAGRGEKTFVLGVAFGFQMAAELPLAAHDVRMDAVVTDAAPAFFTTGSRQASKVRHL
jgi:5-formyltetrahydrofolate cyclo-ligase